MLPVDILNEQKVLLIDHSYTALAIICKLIQKNIDGVNVDIATSSTQAIEFLQQNRYSLISMSRNLPDMGCHQLVEKIRVGMNIRSTPIIILSGESMDIFEDDLACQLVNGYFDKKLGQKKLVAYVRSFLSQDAPEAIQAANILYVEDSPTVAQAVKTFLTRHGHNYLLAKDAEHALQHLKHSYTQTHIEPFDLLITDIELEGHMSGRDLIREVRHGLGLGYAQLPILVTTSSNYESDPRGLNRIFTAGANDMIEKPVVESLLTGRLNNLLLLRQQYQQLHAQAPVAMAKG